MQLIRVFICFLFVLVSTEASVISAESSAPLAHPVPIGAVVPLTGPFAGWAFGIRGGLELGAQDAGSVVRLIVDDDRCDHQQAMTVVSKMLSIERITLFVGPCSPRAFEAVSGIAGASHALFFSISLLDDDIFGRYHNLINLSTQISVEAAALARHVATLKTSRVALVHGDTTFGEEFSKHFLESLKGVGVAAASEAVPLDTTDFRPIILRFLKQKIEIIAIEHGEESAGLLVRQARQLGYHGKFVGYYGLESPSFLAVAGSAAEGMHYTFPLIPSSEAKNSFEKRFRERYHREPNASAFFAYDGITLLAEAVKKCGGAEVSCIRKHFVHLDTVGVSGTLAFHADGKLDREFGIKEVRGGKFLWTANN